MGWADILENIYSPLPPSEAERKTMCGTRSTVKDFLENTGETFPVAPAEGISMLVFKKIQIPFNAKIKSTKLVFCSAKLGHTIVQEDYCGLTHSKPDPVKVK